MVDPDALPPPEKFTTHKDRAMWFSQRVTYPMRDADPSTLEAFYAEQRARALPDKQWKPLGPNNVGGRVTGLAADPNDSNILFAATAAGGVWNSNSGGRQWNTAWPQWFTLNIGSICIDPDRPTVIYCGSGEANFSADDYPGSGVFCSSDGGGSWKLTAPAAECGIPRRIGVIAVDPRDRTGRTIYLGGISHDDSMTAGMYFSKDGGSSWTRHDFVSEQNYQCVSIAFNPTAPAGTLYAAVIARGARSGIWRKKDAPDWVAPDSQWEHLTNGLPSPDLVGRISLAVPPKEPSTVYALIADRLGRRFLGIYCSRNDGDDWVRVDQGILRDETTQSSYNNTIAVSAADPKIVVCGANDIYISEDRGEHWRRASHWDSRPGLRKYVHSDQHAFVLGEERFTRRIYAGGDGGVFVTEDLGEHWEPRNQDLVATLFYSVAVAPNNSGIIGGGTQDNGTLLTGLHPDRFGEYEVVQSGDGASMVVDSARDLHIFAGNSDFLIKRLTREGTWVEARPERMTAEERKQVPIARLAIDPVPREGNKLLWTGSRRLWHTPNSGGSWAPFSPVFDGTSISAIDVSLVNQGRILVGTARGGIFRSIDGGETWSGDLSGPEMPQRLISDFEQHPLYPDQIVAVLAGSGTLIRPGKTPGTPQRLQHVFVSFDGGLNWWPLFTDAIPDVACYSAAWETNPPFRLFVSNDCGVWCFQFDTPEGNLHGFHTIDWTGNLPTARVTMLSYHGKDRVLTAATYGRGIWRLDVPAPEKAADKTS